MLFFQVAPNVLRVSEFAEGDFGEGEARIRYMLLGVVLLSITQIILFLPQQSQLVNSTWSFLLHQGFENLHLPTSSEQRSVGNQRTSETSCGSIRKALHLPSSFLTMPQRIYAHRFEEPCNTRAIQSGFPVYRKVPE